MKAIYLLLLVFSLLFISGCGYLYEDDNWVYVTYDEAVGRRVKELNADKETFVVLENKNYAKDKNVVFFEGNIIDDADPDTFQVINDEGYSKDANFVFVDLCKVVGGNPKTFIYLDYPYSRDDKSIYNGTLPMFVKNIDEFKVTQRGKSRSTTVLWFFLKHNPEYSFIDNEKYDWVVYCKDSKSETKNQKFVGFKEVQ